MFLVFAKCQKIDKSKFVAEFVGIFLHLFSYKMSQIAKSLLHCVSTDHLKHKAVNKITCRMLSAYPCQQ